MATCGIRIYRQLLAGLLLMLLASSLPAQQPASQQEDEQVTARVQSLIEQLGDEQFRRREFAQRQLLELGLNAYDAIHRAQNHDDIEISKRARYLVRSMRIQWSRADDSPAIRRALMGYASRPPGERRNRMEQLAALPEQQGVVALCRMVRYESTEPLSKYAALLILQTAGPTELATRQQQASDLREAVRQSARTAAEWIRVHATTLLDVEASLVTWDRVTRAEENTLSQFPNRTSQEITRDLLRHQAGLLQESNKREQALAVLRRTINLLDGTRTQLLDMVEWLGDQEIWELVEDVADRFPGEFSKYPDLIYRMAEAVWKQGDKPRADQIAERARQLDPENTRTHIESALWLQRRDLVDWCIKEYRQILKHSELESREGLYARFLLSEILHDRLEEDEAAEVLAGAVEAVKNSEKVARDVQQVFSRTPGSIESRQLYFLACSKHKQQMFDEQKQLLEKAIEAEAHDGDVLIAMYRFKPADPAWTSRVTQLVKDASAHYRQQITVYDNTFRISGDSAEKETARRKLATAHNQLAWMVSNTEGDFQAAIQSSLRSLELRPDSAGYLDTLGHCYYAAGEFQKAVETQLKAVAGDPSSQTMQRMLKVFQQALEDSSK
jgi:tetratricopeptide (TPR) repeat protein